MQDTIDRTNKGIIIKNELSKLFLKYSKIDYFGYSRVLENKLIHWQDATDNMVKGAENYKRSDIIEYVKDLEINSFNLVVNDIRRAIKDKCKFTLISKIRYDQRLSIEVYHILTGINLKGKNNKQLKEYFNLNY